MKNIKFTIIASYLFLQISCSKLEGENNCENCPKRDPESTVSEADVSIPLTGTQTKFIGHYIPIRYLEVVKYNVHIFGTRDVTDWMMIKSHEMIKNILDSLKETSYQDKFKGHELFIITDRDPIVPGGVPGHRNTGMGAYTIINQDLVCRVAVDTIYPDLDASYRAWDTPVHEFGHSLEIQLDPNRGIIDIYKANDQNYNSSYDYEYFSWAIEKWFNASYAGKYTRSSLSNYIKDYLENFFLEENTWTPNCNGYPQKD